MVMDKGKKWLDFLPIGALAYFIRISVPTDVPHLFELREMGVEEFILENLWLVLVGNTVQRVEIVVVLRIMV